ncbi:WhiB family transcriptional regulator [Streptomyces sp. MH60]|uniref:WhiB family transcriptional regulator n=1 Tax=Streptomyces sp. MH60 TaxID=1940758 RepID=UPI000CEEC52E|nr:WhiB family transcriptional regulator [Streptomyces sp. MH60]PPS89511.1 Transcriptional regulator WhiB [Streptomyces sp. MH60]
MTAYAFPCAAKPHLFGSGKGRSVKAVREALRICANCPVQPACRRAGREGHEFGIWGGETEPERFAYLGITEEDILPPECGTEKASRRHRELGEECEECTLADEKRQEAEDEAAAERRRKRQEYEEIPGSRINPHHAPLRTICGTFRGYRAHEKRTELRLDPHPDCTCREACRAYRAEQRATDKEAKAGA